MSNVHPPSTGSQEPSAASVDDLMALANWIPQLMWIANAEGKATYLNRRWLEYAAADSGRIDPESIILHPDDIELARVAWAACVASGEPFEREYRLQRKDGEFRWHLTRAVATLDPKTGLRRWFGTCTDIHDERDVREARVQARKRIEDVSRENARLASFINVQQDIATSDHEPKKLMRLIAERLRGHTGADSAGVALLDGDDMVYRVGLGALAVMDSVRIPAMGSEAGQMLMRGEPVYVSDAMHDSRINPATVTKVGARSFMMAPLRAKGRTIGVVTASARMPYAFGEVVLHEMELMTDLLSTALMQADEFASKQATITALRATESDLVRAREQAEQAARMKAEFLANMSHEIRTPLNGIIGLTDILMETSFSEEQRHYVRLVQNSGNTLLTVVNDILDFSKIGAGKLDIEEVTFDIGEVVTEQANLMAARASEKNITLTTHVDLRLPHALRGDAGRVGQVLLNLLNNAIKFTDHGSINIHAQTMELDDVRAVARISVTDSGMGIDPEAQARLFTPFTQADGSTARRFGGTGLGLSICKRLVELMGGTIEVASEPGEGSTFWFTLPLARAPAETVEVPMAPAPAKLPAGAWRGRVLVAEDNAVNQLIAATMLKGRGYAAHTVANGVEALAALELERYDLVLMDCQMPEMDGFDATRSIRAKEQQANAGHLPIVALTANAMREDAMRCRASGMDDHLAKPIKRAQLGAALERWIAPSKKC